MEKRLKNLGFSEQLINESKEYDDYLLGRVITQSKSIYRVATRTSEITSEISGKFRFSVASVLDYPTVGDFVVIDSNDKNHGNAIIHKVLPRKSMFVRKAAGTTNEIQAIAANIDTVFICTSLNKDFNLRRLERYLSVVWDSGAIPVIVLTKSDLCDNLPEKLLKLQEVTVGIDVITTSSAEEGVNKRLLGYVRTGQTVAFIGSSGVGKSTLINCLLGKKVLKTDEIGKDDRGRHVTSKRELIIIPSGGAVIDTPGMREVGLEVAIIHKTFDEIDRMAIKCKFNNCKHDKEPGCAVAGAINEGLILKERLTSYKKLQKEVSYNGLNSKQIEKEKINKMFAEFNGVKNAKKYVRFKKNLIE
jgi:ribosome biogenesis GTPase